MATEDNTFRFLGVLDKIVKMFATLGQHRKDITLTKTELRILELLFRKGELTMSQIAQNMEVSMSTATGIVGKLVDKRLVTRERKRDDRRVVKIALTEEGKKTAISHEKEKVEMARKLTELLTPEEFEKLTMILERIAERIAGDEIDEQ